MQRTTNTDEVLVPEQHADTETPRTPAAQLKKLAFTVLHDVYHLGDDLATLDLDKLAERIGRIHAGMNPQNEFHAIVSWLGQCTTINAIQDAGTGENEPATQQHTATVFDQGANVARLTRADLAASGLLERHLGSPVEV
jgi:hypothetical protein